LLTPNASQAASSAPSPIWSGQGAFAAVACALAEAGRVADAERIAIGLLASTEWVSAVETLTRPVLLRDDKGDLSRRIAQWINQIPDI
jgi:hypothetical protein